MKKYVAGVLRIDASFLLLLNKSSKLEIIHCPHDPEKCIQDSLITEVWDRLKIRTAVSEYCGSCIIRDSEMDRSLVSLFILDAERPPVPYRLSCWRKAGHEWLAPDEIEAAPLSRFTQRVMRFVTLPIGTDL